MGKKNKIKKVVYTVLIGNYKLHEPQYINKDWKLICFTNKDIVSKNWTIVRVNDVRNPIKKAREIKIRCDKYLDFDVCLFIDAKFVIKCDLNRFIEKNLKHDIALMTHPSRDCVYNEGNFCIKANKGNKKDILKQMSFYKNRGLPLHFGLYGTGILIRNNTPAVIKFMKMWYKEIEKYSCRDQISFSYILWKAPIKFSTMHFRRTYSMFRYRGIQFNEKSYIYSSARKRL